MYCRFCVRDTVGNVIGCWVQVMQARASERKWESDRDVSACSGCGKKFSVSVRKVS